MELGQPAVSARKPGAIARWILLAGVVLVAGGALARLYLRSGPRLRASDAVFGHVVPPNAHVRVEVLNATDTKGLARRAMLVLRSAGFDVVFFGNSAQRSDTTRVLDRSGHANWAALAARVMGHALVEEQPDTTRFLDLTVLVGRNWSPPLEPLYP